MNAADVARAQRLVRACSQMERADSFIDPWTELRIGITSEGLRISFAHHAWEGKTPTEAIEAGEVAIKKEADDRVGLLERALESARDQQSKVAAVLSEAL